MFERMTEEFRQMMVLCQREARHMGYPVVRTGHLLLAILAEKSEGRGVLERGSVGEARLLGSSRIGTGHVLVAIVEDNDCLAGRLLRRFGVVSEALRAVLAADAA